ncbi:MAG: thioredoxin family protein [Candidatus Thorarchaeota archaeon]
MVREVTFDDVDHIIGETRLVFVDCWAQWCVPCEALLPIINELDEKYSSNPDIAFIKINVQEYHEFSVKYNIFGLPCNLVFFDGEPAEFEDPSGKLKKKTDRLIGKRSADHFEAVIEQLLPQ